MSVRLLLFGPPRLAQAEGWLSLTFERRNQLLAHLALRRRWVPRTELAATLWPLTPAEQAHANLRKTLFRTRTLPWESAIVAREQALAYEGTSDVAEFDRAIDEQRWSDAMEIADATLLAGFDDDASEPWSAWLRDERERLRRAWRVAAGHCLSAMTDPADALALAARLLAEDPLDEAALHAQMLAYAQQGQPARARQAYGAYAAQLAREIGVAPSPELRALHDALGLPDSTLSHTPTSDREQRLVGRTAERRAIRTLLEDGCRLLCLIGPGGVGKSCLARQVLVDLAQHYPDGTAYVPLDDIASADALGTRLARELSVPVARDTDPLHAVIAALQARRMLLVLDNFEHLRPAADRLQTLLDACARVQIVVTSRLRLGLASEHLLALDGLPCPAAEDVERIEAFDAARLFIRAARAVDPALQPAAEADAIALICRLVDGLPLALEIAAGWTRVLSCEAIAAELRQGIELLTESDAARPARHASMAVVFDQSWRRLSPGERSAWARLTLFHGGFTSEAARVVADASLPVLAALTDQSLLRQAGARIELHPLLRQLAAQRLAEGERDEASAAHAAYYLQWLVPLWHALQVGDKQTLQQVDVEFENIRAAWRWACVHGPAAALQSTALPLMTFCELRGRPMEGLAMLRDAATGVGARDTRLGPLLEAAMAFLEFRLYRFADAQKRGERALRASRALRDHNTRLQCYRVLGLCATELGPLSRARRRFRQALALAPAAIDPRNAVSMLGNLATVEDRLGRFDAARTLFMQALDEQRRLGDALGVATTLNNLGVLEASTGDIDAGIAHFEASLALCERDALQILKLVVLVNLTELMLLRNRAAEAQCHGEHAYELARQIGNRSTQLSLQLLFAQMGMQQRDLPAARNALRAAAEIAIAVDDTALHLDCISCLSRLLYEQGAAAAAIRVSRYALSHPAFNAEERERAHGRLAAWASSAPEAAALPVPALVLWTLLHRVVAETPAAYAALIEDLRAP